MNKKITPRVIRLIALQSVLLIITVTIVGGAVITHQKYKNASNSATTSAADNTNENADGSIANSEVNSTQTTTTTNSANATSEIDENKFPYAYAGFVPQEANVNADISKFLVNGNYILPDDYKPTLAEAVKGSGVYLDYRVAPYYQAMYDAALEDGITLTPVSGYRSYERQKNNFENRIQQHIDEGLDRTEATKKAATVIMLPGSSEHNAGLAMDICSLSESFENTKEFDWLSENAADYGFILRYPKDENSRNITGVVYEPWHYRFVGVETAKDINSNGVTLEEYLGLA